MSDSGQPAGLTRRRLIEWLVGVGGVILAALLFGRAFAFLWPTAETEPVDPSQEVGAVDGWELWRAKKVMVAGRPVLVIRTDQGFVALSAVCTHLGCHVEFDAVARRIHCPCHDGLFDLEGRVLGGPPPQPLPKYTIHEDQGKVHVSP